VRRLAYGPVGRDAMLGAMGTAMLGAVGIGAVWGWLVAMAWPASPRARTTVVLGAASVAPAGLASAAGGAAGLFLFTAAAVVFAGAYAAWQWWLAGSSVRGRE
jgi:hypothetical protein